MFLPLGTDRPLRRPTLVNHVLVALNVGIFVAMMLLDKSDPARYQRILNIMHLGGRGGSGQDWYRFVSYAFAHGSWMHLLGNMLILWVFGPAIEDRFRRAGYLLFYLAAAVLSGAAHVALEDNPVIGASGAIAGVTGAFLILMPLTQVRMVMLFFFIGVYWVPAWWFIGFAVVKDLLFFRLNDGVARGAHLAGYFVGAGVAMTLLATRLLPREPYDLFMIGKQAYRRRQFKEFGVHHDEAMSKRWQRARSAETPGLIEQAAPLRAAVMTSLGKQSDAEAAAAYRELVDKFAASTHAVTLQRRQQIEIANLLFSAGDHALAAYAYERFLEYYAKDPETPRVRLMLGLINARHLNDPVRAKQVLAGLETDLHEDEQKNLARTLVAELA